MAYIKNGILYGDSEGNFRMKKGIKFVRSARGAFGRFQHLHIVGEDGKTRCGRVIPKTWIPVGLDIEAYFDEPFICGNCVYKFEVLERVLEDELP